ncbi:MAG: DUF2442 domain-containing protein [Acidobacteria bacterium]|nr:DUF2442 domain-containing protein [Acidobacteriota bacterium]
MSTCPKVKSVTPLPGKRLLITFVTEERRIYDCTPLLDEAPFSPLRDEAFFRQVREDAAGYGVAWSDTVDLSESELWLHGTTETSS